MEYFDQVTFTTNVMRKKICVDILCYIPNFKSFGA